MNGKKELSYLKHRLIFFFSGAYYTYRALFAWLVPQVYLLTKVINPLFQILFFSLLGNYYTGAGTSYYVIGNAIQISALSSIYGVSMTLVSERQFGTLVSVLGTPANRVQVFVSRSMMHILDGLLSATMGFVFGTLFLGLDLSNTNIFSLYLVLLVTIFSTCGLGLVIGSFGLVLREVNLLSNLVYYSLILFCGINFPISILPAPLQKISFLLPMTRGVMASRMLIEGQRLFEVKGLLMGEFLIGIAYFLIGFCFFKLIETVSHKHGKFDFF